MVQGHMQMNLTILTIQSYNFVELQIPNFIKMERNFPISWILDPNQKTLKNLFWNLEYWKYTVFRTFLLHALTYYILS